MKKFFKYIKNKYNKIAFLFFSIIMIVLNVLIYIYEKENYLNSSILNISIALWGFVCVLYTWSYFMQLYLSPATKNIEEKKRKKKNSQ